MILENEQWIVTFDTHGGEIASVTNKETNIQYMYQGDTEFWSGKNPTLFPIVGNTYNGTYHIHNQEYQMKNHGLIRYTHLKEETTDTGVSFILRANTSTLREYPFDFRYTIAYELMGSKLKISYKIKNMEEKEVMPFSFGLHPAFLCPLTKEESILDYQIIFAKKEQARQWLYDQYKIKPVQYKDVVLHKIALSYDLFDEIDTLLYDHLQSDTVTLKGKEHGVTLSIENFPYFAIWTPKKGAPFICLEPWLGHGDFTNSKRDFYQREGTIQLAPKKIFETSYTIEFF